MEATLGDGNSPAFVYSFFLSKDMHFALNLDFDLHLSMDDHKDELTQTFYSASTEINLDSVNDLPVNTSKCFSCFSASKHFKQWQQ